MDCDIQSNDIWANHLNTRHNWWREIGQWELNLSHPKINVWNRSGETWAKTTWGRYLRERTLKRWGWSYPAEDTQETLAAWVRAKWMNTLVKHDQLPVSSSYSSLRIHVLDCTVGCRIMEHSDHSLDRNSNCTAPYSLHSKDGSCLALEVSKY